MSETARNHRPFLENAAEGAAAARIAPLAMEAGTTPARRTATDLVPLGQSGVKICRLGIGTGSNGGQVQRDLGQEGFDRLVRHAYDRGVTFIDTADMYQTHTMIRAAIKGLPREKLFLQTKMQWDAPTVPERPLEVLDRFRKELGVDYLDSLLIHCATKSTWPEDLKIMMDAFSLAKERGIVRLKGISCHGLPALTRATQSDWVDVQLARVNPQGRHVDGKDGTWAEPGIVPAAMGEIRAMHAQGRGVIGMKMVGNGDFQKPEERETALRFAMTCGFVDAVVIGFAGPAEIDEAIERIDRALLTGPSRA